MTVTVPLSCTGTGAVEQAGIDPRKTRSSPRGAFLSFPLHTWIRLASCQTSPPARKRAPRASGKWEGPPDAPLVGGPLAQPCMN